jgi:hypothetical protein
MLSESGETTISACLLILHTSSEVSTLYRQENAMKFDLELDVQPNKA